MPKTLRGVRRLALPLAATVTTAVGAALAVPAAAALGTHSGPAAGPGTRALPANDTTSALEARRVDSVPTPKPAWHTCKDYDDAQCATVRLPLDYDHPKGATVELGLLRVPAHKPKQRVGTLFVNPGGPGIGATGFAYDVAHEMPRAVSDHFDVVGVDPRGVGSSAHAVCFTSAASRKKTLKPILGLRFPETPAEEKAYLTASKAYGAACAAHAGPLLSALSTAEDARDMDVLRRAVGDKKLTYYGVSYGTVLGQYYADMFPDRVRAVAIDGVVDARAWVGDATTAGVPQADRLRSPQATYRALHEFLLRCDRAGGERCSFALGDPVANFDVIAGRLRVKAARLTGDDGKVQVYTYADFIDDVRSGLYDALDAEHDIPDLASKLLLLTEPPAKTLAVARERASSGVMAIHRRIQQRTAERPAPGRLGSAYDTDADSYYEVHCTDGLHPATLASLPGLAAKADAQAPYFGRDWSWSTAPCAGDAWSARDEDAYTGPFTHRTVAPVLVVGNYWDPATDYDAAVAVSRKLPNSRLLSSDSWGHTAYLSSSCVNKAIEGYLARLSLPKAGTVCKGVLQPFADRR